MSKITPRIGFRSGGLAAILALGAVAPSVVQAQAALQCPGFSGVSGSNLIANPGFETTGPNGSSTTWPPGPIPVPSAAASWYMHSDNAGDTVTSKLITTTAPGPNGTKMIDFIATGNESGIYQVLSSPPAKMYLSAWVFVKKGVVVLQPNGGALGPSAFSHTTGQWEQLRVCSDGSVSNSMPIIWNEAVGGGEFYVDRVEAYALP